MPKAARLITADDILPLATYAAERKARRAAIVELKRRRRLAVGPYATLHFECFETMWMQVQEMLYIEKGGDEQLADELAAYNPMIPKGAELTCTLMFEIEDEFRRARILSRLGGIEDSLVIRLGPITVRAVPEGDVERTKADGKTSAVHFLHFPFTPEAIAAFKDPGVEALIAFEHPDYGHLAVIPPATRAALAEDFAG